MSPPTVSTAGLPARQEQLLAALRAADDELSGQALHARLRAGQGAMGLATVYRHLRQLQQRGLVRCRHLPSGEALYAPTERDEHHLTCVDCGRTLRLPHCPVHGLELPKAHLEGFQPLFHTLEFFGLCALCQQSGSPPPQRLDGSTPPPDSPQGTPGPRAS